MSQEGMWNLFEDFVRLRFTVTRIRKEMSLRGYDLSEYEEIYLIRRMLSVEL